MSPGLSLVSSWFQDFFTAEDVKKLSVSACPNFPLCADPTLIAERINEAANEMLLGIQSETTPSESQKWALDLAKAAAEMVKQCARPVRIATRLNLDPTELFAMQKALKRVRTAAGQYAHTTSLEKQKGRPGISPAEDRWLATMTVIFENCFDRKAGTTSDRATSQSGGPAPRFIAEAAAKLSDPYTKAEIPSDGPDPKAKKPPSGPNPWEKLSDTKTIASRIIARRVIDKK